jgi:hypothetical protein
MFTSDVDKIKKDKGRKSLISVMVLFNFAVI